MENKKKIGKKMLMIGLLVNLLIGCLYLNYFEVNAAEKKDEQEEKKDTVSITSMEKDATDFISHGEKKAGTLTKVTESITENFMGLGQLLTMIGAGVMVAVVSYMGIKYIMSPPDKQAALKQQLIGVVVAGIVIFGAYGIWKAVLGVVSNF